MRKFTVTTSITRADDVITITTSRDQYVDRPTYINSSGKNVNIFIYY